MKDFPAGFKLNIGFSLSIGNLYERKNNVYQKIITAKQILNKADVFHHIDEVFYDFSKVFEKSYTIVSKIDDIIFNINKIKPLNGKSYISLPEWIANKKAVINIKNEDKKLPYLFRFMWMFKHL